MACDAVVYSWPGPMEAIIEVGEDLGGPIQISDSFSLAQNKLICAVEFYADAKQSGGSTDWAIEITIEGDDGGKPDGIPLGTGAIHYTNVATPAWNKVGLSVNVSILAATTYWVVFKLTPCPIPGSLNDWVEIGLDDVAETYLRYFGCTPGVWVGTPRNVMMKIYEYIPPPDPPTGLTITRVSDTETRLDWTDVATNEDGYTVQRETDTGDFSALASLGAGVETYTDSTTLANKRYRYRVRAYKGAEYSAWLTSDYFYTTPAEPSTFTAKRGSVILAWTDDATWEQGYEIQRRKVGDSWAALTSLAAGATTYEDLTAEQGVAYEYRVRAFRTTPTALYSTWVSVTIVVTDATFIAMATDVAGDVTNLFPTAMSWRLSENAAMELTLEFDNADGRNTNIIVFDDVVTVEANP